MSKTRDTGFLANVIQVHDTGVRIMSGSTMLMAVSSSGAVTITGEISGSDAANSLLLSGTGSVGFTTTSSFLAVSSSQQQVSASYTALSASYNTFSGSASTRITENSSSIQQVSSSLLQVSASYTALSGSYNTFSGSASTRITVDSASLLQVSSSQQQISASLLNVISIFATTGSNSFRANQSITGSLVVSSTITAQTLIVQTVTSSIVYSSGSNIFGCDLNSRQTFTGSVLITGSLTIAGASSATFNGDITYNNAGNQNLIITSGAANNGRMYIYSAGNADIGFQASGSSWFLNKLGIGTNSPAVLFTIGKIGTANQLGFYDGATAKGFIGISAGTSDIIATDALNDMVIRPSSSGNMLFAIGSTERMRITSTGIACFACQVCAPSFIGGTLSGTTIYGSTAVCSPVGKFTSCIDAGTGTFSGNALTLSGNNPALTISTGQENLYGYINIVAGTASNVIYTLGNTYNTTGPYVAGALALIGTTSGGISISATCASGCIRFYTCNTERMTITSGGDVLMGYGNVGGIFIRQTVAGTVDNNSQSLGNNGINYMNRVSGVGLYHIFFNNGNNIVGTITSCTTATQFNTTSDYRLKTDLKNYNGICLINQIKTYDFAWKLNDARTYGVIAHELSDIIPYAVTGEKDALDERGCILPQAVDYSKIVTPLIKAVQEQQCTICSQASMINTLKTCLGIS